MTSLLGCAVVRLFAGPNNRHGIGRPGEQYAIRARVWGVILLNTFAGFVCFAALLRLT